jgi:tetratricopeptide (TPR) repeat protein
LNKSLSDLELKGEENTPLYATRLNNLAQAYTKNNHFFDARKAQRKCIKIDKRTLDKIHVDYLKHLLNYAIILSELKKNRFAEKVFQIAKIHFDNNFYESHPGKANFYFWLGVFYGKMKKLFEAQDFLETSLAVYAQNYGYENPNTIRAIEELAIVKQFQKQIEG